MLIKARNVLTRIADTGFVTVVVLPTCYLVAEFAAILQNEGKYFSNRLLFDLVG